MLRRVSRVLRITLLVVGCALVVWLPVSFIYGISLILPWPGAYGSVTMFSGKLSFSTRQENTVIRFDSAQVDFFERRSPLLITPQHLLPSYNSSQVPDPGVNGVVWQRTLTLPLWLLAFLCLAWPATSFINARRKRRRGFPVEPKGDQMFIVLLDEPGLFVFPSTTDAVRFIEPIDAETEVRTAFDASGIPYRVEWIRPNRRGIFMIEPGEYRFAPAGPADTPALIRLLEAHPEHAQPSEANTQLRSLLARLRAVDRYG